MPEAEKPVCKDRPIIKDTSSRPNITWKRLGLVGLILFSIIVGVALPGFPYRYQLTLILAVPALLLGMYILKNPSFGIYCFYIYEFTRPDGFIPALRPLKVVILIQLVTFVSWLLYLLRTERGVKWDGFNWFYLGFVMVMAATVPIAVNNRSAYDVFQVMASYFIMFFISTYVIVSFKKLNVLVWIILIIHFYFALRGVQSGGLVGGSLMGDENDFALALNVMIPFAFFSFMDSRGRFKKYFSLLILTALVLGVVSSMSRGGWVGLVVALTFCVFKSKRKLISLFIAFLMVAAVISFAPEEYWEEIYTISNTQEATARSRIEYWQAALRMYADNPIIGVGGNNGGRRMQEYYVGDRDAPTTWGRTFHGTFPQVIAELGTLGLFCYIMMLIIAFKYLRQILRQNVGEHDAQAKTLANSIMGGIVAYIATATFLSTTYYPQLWTLYNLTIILVYCCRSTAPRRAGNKDTPDRNEGAVLQN